MRNELSGYFDEYIPDGYLDDGSHVRAYYRGFIYSKFSDVISSEPPKETSSWLSFDCKESIFDTMFSEQPAQYATKDASEKPITDWDSNNNCLKDLKTNRLHYVRPPQNLIVIDFDLKNDKGEKDLSKNIEAASKWPPTYAELSKSGSGIHLHYLYNGDISNLDSLYAPGIEIKTFPGKASLRRALTWCNDLDIANITSGLPVRKDKKEMTDMMQFKSQRHLFAIIAKQLRKGTHDDTHRSVSMILKALNDAYDSGMPYYIPENMREAIKKFAESSTNQKADCLRMVKQMKFESDSEDWSDYIDDSDDKPLAFFDIEVYPNLLLVCYKEVEKECQILINPKPNDIEFLYSQYRLIGFNNRKYDNHILYSRYMGMAIYDCYKQSTEIISSKKRDSEKRCFHKGAYGRSYTDVYDYSTAKQSLKKWEIELGLTHKEMELDWNEPVKDEDIPKIVEYCCNDVIATEAVWNATQADFKAREILAKWANMSVNTPTNTLTAAIIFGKSKNNSDSFNWRDLSEPIKEWINDGHKRFLQEECGRFVQRFDDRSVVPYFDGYTFIDGKSQYRGFDPGEGGFVYAEPGSYVNVALLDVESMHPNSFIDEIYAGVGFTRTFKEILDLRLCIKHGEFEVARKMFNGKLSAYLEDEGSADALSFALKIAINSVYGLTSAKFENAFYNPRNVDNIVAKRGALFMIDLLYSVQEAGFTVAHIKTDSIKIPDATPEIISMVMDIGHRYVECILTEARYECIIRR